MITFEISTGKLRFSAFGVSGDLGSGYSGAPGAINDPSMCQEHSVGPIPPGLYAIGEPIDSPHTGPYSLPLSPDAGNEMFGRGSFLIHGGKSGEPSDAPAPGDQNTRTARTASEGCIITSRDNREAIWDRGHRVLQVI